MKHLEQRQLNLYIGDAKYNIQIVEITRCINWSAAIIQGSYEKGLY